MSKLRTKKNRAKGRKDHLWTIFDQEMHGGTERPVECVYRNKGERESCDVCGTETGLSPEGFYTCKNTLCGALYTDALDLTPEWRYYGADEGYSGNPTRCGAPMNPLLSGSSFGCKVVCEGNSTYEMRKIRRYTEWQAMPYRDRSLNNEYQRITIMGTNAGIPKMIINEACKYHKKISERKTFRGLNRGGIIAASIYIACRIERYPRTAKEIAKIFHLDHCSATKGCKNAMSIINEIEQETSTTAPIEYSTTDPIAFIDRYCSSLHINNELTKLSQFVAIQLEKNNSIPENTPPSIAAGIVYFVSQVFGLGLNKKNIHAVSDISEVTINKCYKKMHKIQASLIPAKLLEKYRKP